MALLGGWSINQNIPKADLDDDLKKIFETATKKLVGGKYEAIEFLGSQVVNGINYKYLGYISAAGTLCEGDRHLCIITIHANNDGDVKVTKTKDVFED